jgi:hypothetical protein
VNDLIEVHVGMHHEFYSEVVKNELLWDPLQGGPQTGVSGRGSKMSKNCKKNKMLVQCNELEEK